MSTVTQHRGITLIELGPSYDSLDDRTLEAFGEVLLSEAAFADPPRVLLDLSRTNYVGSRFIELMVRAWKRLKMRGGEMALCGVQPFCAEVLQATRLDGIWPVFSTRDEALGTWGASDLTPRDGGNADTPK